MKCFFLLFPLVFFLSGCEPIGTQDHHVYEIYRESSPARIGVAVEVADHTYLTTLHTVRDDRYIYSISVGSGRMIPLSIIDRDPFGDLTLLSSSQSSLLEPPMTLDQIHLGVPRVESRVTVTRILSGSLSHESALVVPNTRPYILDSFYRTTSYTGYTLSGISIRPGDSGSPIYDEQGRLIDLVHIGNIK